MTHFKRIASTMVKKKSLLRSETSNYCLEKLAFRNDVCQDFFVLP